MKRTTKTVLFVFSIVTLIVLSLATIKLTQWLGYFPSNYYRAADFGVVDLRSPIDANQNGIDDFSDLVLGTRADAVAMPKYKSAYYAGGYPPINEGVCTDLMWRAFKTAGYDLKSLVDTDIQAAIRDYPGTKGKAEPNIDFRRVRNLKVFFDRNAQSLTSDLSQLTQWQPGDIVVFGKSYTHIAIISDRRNAKGIPYLIHNSGQPVREEDALVSIANSKTITGHYRWLPIRSYMMTENQFNSLVQQAMSMDR